MTMTNRTLTALQAALYAAIDDLAFAAPQIRPALRETIATGFTVYRTALKAAPALDLCATCDAPTPAAELAPLSSDEIYERAARVWSFERDDALCPCCRAEFEAEHGRADQDVYHVFDRGVDPRD